MSERSGTGIFVLVHGAYHGGWCWDAVARELRAAGHAVFAPTLTGLSERREGFSRRIDLNTHVDEVVTLAQDGGLQSIHLVGWSYGGMVTTGVLAKIPERIRSSTYLDAYLPGHGEAVASFLRARERIALSIAGALGIGVPPPDPEKWGVHDQATLDLVKARLSPQPARTLTQRVFAPEPWPAHVEYSYIWCRGYAGSGFGQFYAKATRDSRFRTRELASSHAAVLTHPGEVAEALRERE